MKNKFLILLLLIVTCLGCSNINNDDYTKIQNIKAFTETYGLVRWFYPSDEVQDIDWNKLAVYGVNEVASCQSTDELSNKLSSIFTTIAPGVTFSDNPIYEKLDSITPSDTTGMSIVAWQHYGVDLGLWSNNYVSKRINRPLKTQNTSKLAIYNSIPAAHFEDDEVTISVRIKNNSNPDELKIFYRIAVNTDMGKDYVNFCVAEPDLKPISNNGQWQTYSYNVNIADDKDKVIVMGIYTEGDGAFSVGEVIFNGVDASNFGMKYFQNVNQIIYDYQYRGNHIDISTKNKIFNTQSEFGNVATQKIADGLYIHVPLALYGTKQNTYPVCDNDAVALIKNKLESIQPSDMDLMQADILVTWNVMKYFQPYLAELNIDWEEELLKALDRTYSYKKYDSTPLRLMIACLKDAHISVVTKDYDYFYENSRLLPFGIQKINDQLVVDISYDPQIQCGDIILRTNNKLAINEYVELERLISGSAHHKTTHAAGLWLRSFGDNENVKLEINRGNDNININVNTLPFDEYIGHRMSAIKEKQSKWINNHTLYINLVNSNLSEIKNLLSNRTQDQTVILDMRNGTSFMLHNIYPLLFADNTLIPLRRNRCEIPHVVSPDITPIIDTLANIALKAPNMRNIFLVGSLNVSNQEEVLDYVRYAGLGYLIGTNTAGCNGAVNVIYLPSTGQVGFTGMKVLSNSGMDHYYYGIGIKPHLFIENTLEDIKNGRDAVLDAAIELAN